MLLYMGLFSRFVSRTCGSGHHHDPAAQHGAGAPAELPQQPGLGAAGIRPVAAEPVVMIARNQKALLRRGTRNHAGDEFEAVAQARIGIRASGHSGRSRRAAGRWSIRPG